MNNIEKILEKIKEEINKNIEEINKEYEQKKYIIKEKYENLINDKKKQIEEEFKLKLEINKKRIYSEIFVEYNKKIEELKNLLFKNLIEKIKKFLLNMEKEKYYTLLKNFLLKNLFLNEKNLIIFDNSNKLNMDEKKSMVNEILKALDENLKKTTLVEIDHSNTSHHEFGIKIYSEEKSRELSLETIIDILRSYCEEKINELVYNINEL